jgi:hypothetical protein
MRQLTVYTAAAFVLAALVASVPAKAEYFFGSAKNGAQCWTPSPMWAGSGGGTYGFWGACPATAAVATAPKHHHHHHA